MKTGLAPGLLVATPTLVCPFFHHSVVLMVDHDERGSFGFVINKGAGVLLDAMLDDLGLARSVETGAEVLMGGPVSPQSGWIVYDRAEAIAADGDSDPSVHIGDQLAFTSSMGALELIARGDGPSRDIVLLGYSGWSPGQLESEMAQGSWIPADLDLSLLFDVPVDERWAASLDALGIDPGRVTSSVSLA